MTRLLLDTNRYRDMGDGDPAVVRTLEDAFAAARAIRALGASAVLVKGGHLEAAPGQDVLVSADEERVIEAPWIDTPHTHGTGCTYSAAIATHLAFGHPLADAIVQAKAFLTNALRAGFPVGAGVSPPDPLFGLPQPRVAR